MEKEQNMKKRLDIRIAEELRDEVDLVSTRNGQTVTAVVERYVRDGLAHENGELIEQSSLPAIRQTVREEVGKAMQELYQQLSTDLQKAVQRGDNRLAALIVRSARYAGIGQNLVYSLMMKTVGQDFASMSFVAAKEQIGKEIARPDER